MVTPAEYAALFSLAVVLLSLTIGSAVLATRAHAPAAAREITLTGRWGAVGLLSGIGFVACAVTVMSLVRAAG